MGDLEAGFAKLQGEDFEYYMQTYSIILGRNSKKSTVDIDLSGLGGGMNISRQHARIYYDFDRKRFALEVIGKNGCLVEGVLYLPGSPPIKLDSQDLLQIGDKKFYFLLPVRSIVSKQQQQQLVTVGASAPPTTSLLPGGTSKKRAGRNEDEGGHHHHHHHSGSNNNNNNNNDHQPSSKKGRSLANQEGLRVAARDRKQPASSWSPHEVQNPYMMTKQGFPYHSDQKADSRRRVDHETDIFQQMQAEEKDVVSAVATVLSDLCGPGEWMPMAKLHSELLEHYSGIWHQSRIRKFLTSDDWPDSESKGRPWVGLLALLRKYPEHFVINTRSKGRMTAEFVSLVSLLS